MNEGYHRVRLVSADHGLATDLAIPPFPDLPEVILWGNRAFLLMDRKRSVYSETSSYAAPFEDDA